MLPHLNAYFAAEKAESLVFLAIGLVACVFAVFALWRARDPHLRFDQRRVAAVALAFALWRARDPHLRGMAIPVLVAGLIQVAVGATIPARTDAQ